MKLHDPLPKELEGVLTAHLAGDESIRYCLRSDLTLNRRFGGSYLIVTNQRVLVLDHSEPMVALALDKIREIEIDELFGSGRLMGITDEGKISLIFYSKAMVPEFAVLCRVINNILRNRDPEIPQEDQPAHCSQCGSPLPDRSEHCPLCVPRLQILRRLLGQLGPYKIKAFVMISMTFVTVASQMAPPYITKLIVDDVIEVKDLRPLPLLIALMVVCGIVLLGSRVVGSFLTAWLGARVVADLRASLHTTLQRLRMSYFQRRESGQIIGRVTHDTRELQMFLIDGVPYFLVECLSLLVIAGILLYMDAKLALLVFLPVPFLMGGGAWFWGRLIPLFHKHGSKIGAIHSILGESIHGIKTIKAFSREGARSRQFDETNEHLFGVRVKLENTFIGFFHAMSWVMSLGIAGVWFFAARRIVGGDRLLTLGDLLAFVGYIWLFYGPLQWFAAVINWMTHAFSAAERIFAVLDAREEVYDAPDAIILPKIAGAIRFQDVRFSYEQGKEIIKGVSFEIAPGEMIGLVGKSGAGKTTLINLMCRFYDVDSGSITVDGHPIQKIKLAQLRGQLGLVMQEPFLVSASIIENISYGSPGADFDAVMTAAKAANAHEFILDKEDGYDTVLGERGGDLSGGEKQRIAIARAILHNPPILILDEATSSVDTETEAAIQDAIGKLIRGKTTIAIAHRLSTLRNADRLIVIDDGKIVETGSHDELLSRDGLYAKLIRMQLELSRLRAEISQE